MGATVDASSCGTATGYGVATTYGTAYHGYQYPTVFALPIYTLGSYSSGADPATLSVLEEIRNLRRDQAEDRKLTRALVERQVGNLGLEREPQFVGILRNNCAQCHGASSPKAGLSLFNAQGQINELSPEQVTELIRRISLPKGDTKKMPPNGELGYSDFAAVINGIASNPGGNQAKK
jgi:hypothetical protein